VSTPILSTKLHVPSVPANLVHRSRLIEKYTQGLEKKLALVSAPAGFGKTTLLSGNPAGWDWFCGGLFFVIGLGGFTTIDIS